MISMIDKKRFVYSQTALRSYTHCPRQFKLKYIDQIKWPAEKNQPQLELEKAAREGALFHRMVEQYFLKIPANLIEKQLQMDLNSNLFTYWRNFCAFAESKFDLSDPDLVFHPEHTIKARIEELTFEAKFDLLIEHSPDTWTAYDWKTSKFSSFTQNDLLNSLQTKVYLCVLSDLNNRNEIKAIKPATLSYFFAAGSGQTFDITREQAEIKNYRTELLDLTHQIRSDEEYPQINDINKCSNCQFRAYCGIKVSTALFNDLENGLDVYDRFMDDFDPYADQ